MISLSLFMMQVSRYHVVHDYLDMLLSRTGQPCNTGNLKPHQGENIYCMMHDCCFAKN